MVKLLFHRNCYSNLGKKKNLKGEINSVSNKIRRVLHSRLKNKSSYQFLGAVWFHASQHLSFIQRFIHWQILAYFSPLKDKAPGTMSSTAEIKRKKRCLIFNFIVKQSWLVFFSSSLPSEKRRKHKMHPWEEMECTAGQGLQPPWAECHSSCPQALGFALEFCRIPPLKHLWEPWVDVPVCFLSLQQVPAPLLSPWTLCCLSGVPR